MHVVNFTNHEKCEKLGKGIYGKVYTVKDNQTGRVYAAKFVHPLPQFRNAEDFKIEVSILASVFHSSLAPLYGFSPANRENKQPPSIIAQYYKNGTLEDLIRKESQGKAPGWWNMTSKTIFLYGIITAIYSLHSKHIVHGDLKPSNIYISDKNEPIIGDYGLFHFVQQNQDNYNGYMAPELLSDTPVNPTEMTDSYSLGMIIFVMFGGKLPEGKHIKQFLTAMRPDAPKSMPLFFCHIMTKCWDQNPSRRLTFDQMIELFYGDLQIDNLNKTELSDYQKRNSPVIHAQFQTQILLKNVKMNSKSLNDILEIVEQQGQMIDQQKILIAELTEQNETLTQSIEIKLAAQAEEVDKIIASKEEEYDQKIRELEERMDAKLSDIPQSSFAQSPTQNTQSDNSGQVETIHKMLKEFSEKTAQQINDCYASFEDKLRNFAIIQMTGSSPKPNRPPPKLEYSSDEENSDKDQINNIKDQQSDEFSDKEEETKRSDQSDEYFKRPSNSDASPKQNLPRPVKAARATERVMSITSSDSDDPSPKPKRKNQSYSDDEQPVLPHSDEYGTSEGELKKVLNSSSSEPPKNISKIKRGSDSDGSDEKQLNLSKFASAGDLEKNSSSDEPNINNSRSRRSKINNKDEGDYSD